MDARLIVVLLGVFLSEQANGLNCTDGMKGLTKYIPCGFRQSSTHCMANTWECDDFTDCPDGSDETFCHYPGRGKTGYIFEYNYTGDVVFPDRSDGLQIETQVMIEKDSTKTKTRTIMKLENPKLFQKANKARGSLLSAKDKAVWEKPIVFDILNNGAITNLRTEGREPDDVLNIKRSIASLFQMKLESTTDYENEETDSTGTCRMKYSVTKKQTFQEPYKSPLKSRKLAALHKYNITKTNDYSDCKYRPAHSFSNVDPIICSDKSKNPFLKSRMKMSCIIYKYDDGKGRQKEPFIHSCHSRERHELNSFAKNKASTPFIVHAERQLSFVQVTTRLITSKLNRPKTKTSLLFSFDGLTKPSFIPNAQDDIDEIKGILEKLTKLAKKDTIAYDLMDFEVPKLYLHLVIHLRWRSKPSTFATIYGRFFKGDYRFWLESALPFFGTEASGAEIHMRIEKGEITEQGAIKLLSRLGVVGDPDKGLLDHILKLCKSPKVKNETVSSTCWLAFGSLVRDYCRGKSSCPQTYIQELKNKYVENLHSQDHHMEVIKDNEKLIIALKAIGNAGQIAHLRLALDILTKWNDHNAIMIAAIESLRRMPLEADAANLLKAQMALLQIFSNKKMCPEIRIVAFSALLNTGPATNMIINLTSTIRSEVNPLVKHYVYTHLKSESKVNCEQKKSCKASRDLQRRLSNVPHEEFDPRFSFSMSHSFEETGIFQLYKEMINMEVVHTPVSAIPRFLKFKNTMKMVGLQFDHMEFKLRQREIVKLMRDLIGPYGSVYDKKTLWDFIRTKRSAKDSFPEVYRRMQETINPKTKSDIPFKATVSSKLFGAEILYLVLNETNPFIQTLIEDGTIKIDKNWWSNSLKAGMNFNVSANDLLFNSIIIIPTCTGIPLHLRANIAGSFAYNFYAEMKSSPMMNLWSWSNKPKDISGTFKECYSMSTYSHGRMYWFYRDSRMGFATHHSISNRCPAPVEKLTFSVQPPSQKLNVTMILAKSKYVHQNSSLSITRFARIKSKNEYEKPVKVKQVPTKSGFSTFFDSMMGGRQGNSQPGPFMGPNPGQGPYMGGPPPGQPQFKDGPNPGSKTAGQLPNPGQGPNRGGPNPGKPQFKDGPNPGSKTAGQLPNPGQGPNRGGPNPGKPQFIDGPNPGSKTAGQLPNPGQGPNRGGPNPGKPQFIDGPNPGSKTLGQNPGPLPNPGQGPNMGIQKHGGSFIDGPPKSVFAKEEEASVNCNTVSQAFLHLEVCSSTENDEKSYREMSWYAPVKNRVDNVEFLYQNVTKDDDKERRFDMQLHLNGENQTTLTEFHIELNTSGKSLEKSPLEGIPSYLGFSLKAFQKTDGKVKHVGCLNSRINTAARQLDIGLGWGKNCSHYAINTTYVYNGKVKNARLDFYSSWKSLPENLEKLTCPKKYLQKQLEKLKGMNAGMGGQGGMGGPQSGMGGPQSGMGGPQSGMGGPPSGMGGPQSGMGGPQSGMGRPPSGMGGPPSGMGGPPSGMGRPPSGMGGPPSGMANSGSSSGMGIPGMGNLPCWTSVNLSISIKDGKRLIMKGFPTPNAEIANFTLPFNSTKAIAKAKDILTYGITDTCKVYRNTENIITFDQRTYSYKPSVGCPHVLAKDCSDKDLFVVFLKRNAKDEKEVTLVVKDKRKRGHTFVIKPDLTVMHDGSALQLKGASKYKSANMPHLCRVTKSDDKVVIRCIAGVSVIANTKKIKVKVTPWYFRYMCGMCGNNNWMASDDIRKSSNADHLGASWLVPGKSCNSECTLVHRPVESKVGKTNKLCITTSPVTRCAPNCQPTKTTTAKFGYNCIDKSSDLAKKTQQQLSNQKFQKVIDAFRNKSKDMKENTEVHVDCQCNCPKS